MFPLLDKKQKKVFTIGTNARIEVRSDSSHTTDPHYVFLMDVLCSVLFCGSQLECEHFLEALYFDMMHSRGAIVDDLAARAQSAARFAALRQVRADWEKYKSLNQGYLVLIRNGDFYATFGEDVVVVQRECEEAKTEDDDDSDWCTCLVPAHRIMAAAAALKLKGCSVKIFESDDEHYISHDQGHTAKTVAAAVISAGSEE